MNTLIHSHASPDLKSIAASVILRSSLSPNESTVHLTLDERQFKLLAESKKRAILLSRELLTLESMRAVVLLQGSKSIVFLGESDIRFLTGWLEMPGKKATLKTESGLDVSKLRFVSRTRKALYILCKLEVLGIKDEKLTGSCIHALKSSVIAGLITREAKTVEYIDSQIEPFGFHPQHIVHLKNTLVAAAAKLVAQHPNLNETSSCTDHEFRDFYLHERVTLITAAGMGYGKSENGRNAANALSPRNLIALTSLSALAQQLAASWGISCYKNREIEYDSNTKMAMTMHYLASIYKTNPIALRDLEYVFIDEVRLVLNIMLSTAVKSSDERRCMFEALYILLTTCKRLYIADADIREFQPFVDYIKSLRPSAMFLYHAPRTNRADTKVEITEISSGMAKLKTSIERGERVMICVESRNKACYLRLKLKSMFKHLNENNILYITGDAVKSVTDRRAAGAFILDPAASVKGKTGDLVEVEKDVFIFTGAINSGVSITIDHFDKAFVFFDAIVKTPTEILQMPARSRTTRDWTLICENRGSARNKSDLLKLEHLKSETESTLSEGARGLYDLVVGHAVEGIRERQEAEFRLAVRLKADQFDVTDNRKYDMSDEQKSARSAIFSEIKGVRQRGEFDREGRQLSVSTAGMTFQNADNISKKIDDGAVSQHEYALHGAYKVQQYLCEERLLDVPADDMVGYLADRITRELRSTEYAKYIAANGDGAHGFTFLGLTNDNVSTYIAACEAGEVEQMWVEGEAERLLITSNHLLNYIISAGEMSRDTALNKIVSAERITNTFRSEVYSQLFNALGNLRDYKSTRCRAMGNVFKNILLDESVVQKMKDDNSGKMLIDRRDPLAERNFVQGVMNKLLVKKHNRRTSINVFDKHDALNFVLEYQSDIVATRRSKNDYSNFYPTLNNAVRIVTDTLKLFNIKITPAERSKNSDGSRSRKYKLTDLAQLRRAYKIARRQINRYAMARMDDSIVDLFDNANATQKSAILKLIVNGSPQLIE